ncbi:enoyl-CoA hydratase/isomerase family protein [Nocardia sp. NPDC005745]|uniref:enoyl-CoA hydratase/isomerase family protein n=1 Tax=Nocardia sp. NPDC005745 TaxID=3157061 RepID=UPI0033E92689
MTRDTIIRQVVDELVATAHLSVASSRQLASTRSSACVDEPLRLRPALGDLHKRCSSARSARDGVMHTVRPNPRMEPEDMAIDFEVSDHIALVTLNSPQRLNAMDAADYQALSEAWTEVRDNTDIRVAVVTGAGDRAFSAGADLKSFLGTPTDLSDFWLTQQGQLLNRGIEMWKPVIAAVNGYCLGGGLTLMLATDIRFATPSASFGLTEVKRGVLAANGGTQRLIEQLPHALAMELLLTGDRFDVQTALQWGLVNRVVETDDLLDTAFATARRISANAPLAVQATKELALRSRDVDRATGLRLEEAMLKLLRHSEDALEGPRAFAEKRAPTFTGR